MAGPFDVEAVAEIEGRRDAAALDLVDDRPVVDTVNRDFTAVAFIVEAPAVFADIGDADGTHAEHPLGEHEISQCLWTQRIYLHEDGVFGFVAAENGAAEQSLVAGEVEAAEQVAQIRIESIGIDVHLRQNRSEEQTSEL